MNHPWSPDEDAYLRHALGNSTPLPDMVEHLNRRYHRGQPIRTEQSVTQRITRYLK